MSITTRGKFVPILAFASLLTVIALFAGKPWPSTQAGYIDAKDVIIEDTGSEEIVQLGGGCNVKVTFEENSCVGKCALKYVLPDYAHVGLDDFEDRIDTKAYIRMVDGDALPVFEPYTLCYNKPCSLNVFDETQWNLLIGTPIESGQVCYTYNAGDGAFVITR